MTSVWWVSLQKNGLLRVVSEYYSDSSITQALADSQQLWEVEAYSAWHALSKLTALLAKNTPPTAKPHLTARVLKMMSNAQS